MDITEHMDRLEQSRMEVIGPEEREGEPFTLLGHVSCHVDDCLGDSVPQPDAKKVLAKPVWKHGGFMYRQKVAHENIKDAIWHWLDTAR